MNITKKEQIRLASAESGLSMTIIEQAMVAIDNVRYDILMSGNSCKMGEIGTLTNSAVKEKAEQTVYNGMMKREVTIPYQPEHNRPKMKFTTKISKELKEKTSGNQFVN